VLAALRASIAGLKQADLEQQLNLTTGKLKDVLKFLLLESPSPIQKVDQRYVRNPVQWQMPQARIERLGNLRRQEQQRMREYIATDRCLMQFLSAELNDPAANACGKCVNCLHAGLGDDFPQQLAEAATAFLNNLDFPIMPRKKWPPGHSFEGSHGNIAPELQNQLGRALCRWGDPGFGELVKRGKQQAERFPDQLVTAAAQLIRERWIPQLPPTWVTCVPSRRHAALVPDFAQRLARELGLPFVDCIRKVRETEPQKTRQNSVQQVHNLDRAFELDQNTVQTGPVLLIDDMVDSRWTFTVLGFKLRQAGSGPVFPFALADTSAEGGD
jgi:ATP-dependent DNA helicase RecQ